MSDHSAAASSSSKEETDDVVESHRHPWIYSCPTTPFPSSDDSIIQRLLELEPHFMPQPDYLIHQHPTSRQDSINWILKVHSQHNFKPVTALLSVNYMDRFLSSHSFPGSGWPYQLLSVACLSLAAKMEEAYVPLLIDLQILEPAYIFDPKTVQRMELLVMSNLKWRLRSVTPFDFVDYFISKIQSLSSGSATAGISILPTISDLILSTIRVTDFLVFPPSVIAAAAVLSAARDADIPAGFYDRINKERVRSCHQLMEELLVDTCPAADSKIRHTVEGVREQSSPVGVLDAAACVSCDTGSQNPRLPDSNDSGEAEPEPKRLRSSAGDVQDGQ